LGYINDYSLEETITLCYYQSISTIFPRLGWRGQLWSHRTDRTTRARMVLSLGQVQNLGMNFLGIDLAKSKKEEIDTSYTSESRPKSFDFGTVQRLALKDSDEALVFLLSK
jgi:hypothetical protein